MKSFIPHGRLFTNQIMDGDVYSFNDLNIDLKKSNIVIYRERFRNVFTGILTGPGIMGPQEKEVPGKRERPHPCSGLFEPGDDHQGEG
ncbi:MAG: hypothetical protein Q8R70_12770 [Methanoregula sp.]|nr:hypothetical protein [Methanoregula sp.]